MEHGWKEGRNPSDKFDTSFYLETHQDIKDANINPLIHYIKHGKKEQRKASLKNMNVNLLKIIKFVKKNPHLIRRAVSEVKLHGL